MSALALSAVGGRSHDFFGREPELEELYAGLVEALAGRGKMFLLSGEPGIGKTRLAAEIASVAAARGARVAWGNCWEGGGAPAYLPWIRIARRLREPGREDASGDTITALLPEMASPEGVDADDDARFRLFDAYVSFLARASAEQPLVLVLDDVHAADQPSLRLLHFLGREIADLAILVLVTFRDAQTRSVAWQSELLSRVARDARQLHLRGLSSTDCARFVERLATGTPAAAVIDAIYRTTEGNPFFIDEVVRLLVAEGRLRDESRRSVESMRIPDAVREAIRRRLAPLPEETRELLRVAATIGRDIDVDLLARIRGGAIAEIHRELTIATEAHVLREFAEGSGRFSFAHPLLRETLYRDLPTAVRADLHRRVAAELGARDDAYRVHAAEIAHHLLCATPRGNPDEGMLAAERAGRRAFAMLAYEEAADWFERALRRAEVVAVPRARRGELLLALGEARRRAGESDAARATFLAAASIGSEIGAPELLARAAIGVSSAGAETGAVDEVLVQLLGRALQALPETDSALRANVLGRLAVALYFTADRRGEEASLEAVAMARRLRDTRALAAALVARHFSLWSPGQARRRLAIADELIALGEEADASDIGLEGFYWRILDLLEVGEDTAAKTEARRFAELAETMRMPRYARQAQQLQAAFALAEARYADAERLANDVLARGERMQVPNAAQFYGVQLFLLRQQQGRLDELVESVEAFSARFPALSIWRCGLALLYAELGRADESRAIVEGLAGNDFSAIARDVNWLPSFALLSEVCSRLDEPDIASQLYRMLRPYAGDQVVVATGAGLLGPVSYYLGLLALTAGKAEEAAMYLQDAMSATARSGAIAYRARAQLAAARARVRTNGDADAEALRWLDACCFTAQHRGMVRLHAEASAFRSTLVADAQRPADDAVIGAAATRNLFAREGDYWRLVFEGNTVHVKDSKGMRYLECLLRHPGEELHSVELVAASGGVAIADAGGDAGAVLDGQARAAYKQRVRDLTEEIEDAQGLNDRGREERARAELDRLSAEISSALGLGGRDRRARSVAERARTSVTKAIAAALRNIDRHNPSLASYLIANIRTGTFCAYAVDAAASLF